MPSFVLHSRLAADTVAIADLPLCRALLMNDSRFPWIVLVPRLDAAREILDLPAGDRALLSGEIDLASDALRRAFRPDKLNIGAIGNIVDQLHIHIVGRFETDAAWPGVVWGHGAPAAYPPDVAGAITTRLRALMTAV